MTDAEPSETNQQPFTAGDPSLQQQIEEKEARNTWVLVLYAVFLRIGWIFKTESVIMPAFLDAISGAGWIRGCLPILNRIGQSVPPLLFAPTLRDQRVKKWSQLATTLMMAGIFLTLATYLAIAKRPYPAWLPYGFLLLYLLFFSASGLNQLVFGVVQGKLIRPNRRGRIMSRAGIAGSVCAIICAWTLLQQWTQRADGGFQLIFCFTGGGFVCAAMAILLLREPSDDGIVRQHGARHFRDAFRLLKSDPNLRWISFVSVLFVTGQILLPHYQRLGRDHFEDESANLMVWVVAQNAGAGCLSVIAGRIADRFGNRLAIRLLVFGCTLTPLVALALTKGGIGSIDSYWITFFVLGSLPTSFTTISNYTLELTGRENHAQYISVLKLSMMVPLLISPLVGWLAEPERLGFVFVFIAISAITGCGCLLTFFIIEPRNHPELRS